MKNETEKIILLEERIKNFELQVQNFEREIRLLKGELAALKKENRISSCEPYNLPIEELDLSVRNFHHLKQAGLNTVNDILMLSDGQFEEILNTPRPFLEEDVDTVRIKILKFINPEVAKQLELEKQEKEAEKLKELKVILHKQSQKLLPVFKLYCTFRTEAAKQDDIVPKYLEKYGIFPKFHKKGINYVYSTMEHELTLLTKEDYYNYIYNKEKFPKMNELFETDTVSFELAKAVILEDLLVSTYFLGKNTLSYPHVQKFKKLIEDSKSKEY